MCVPWESNPQPFALLTQCSTTEPQEHILLPIGGAMIITVYCPLDVFRPGLLPNMLSLVQIGHFMFKLNK